MKRYLVILTFFYLTFSLSQTDEKYVSEVWVADQGDGTYKNTIIYPDYSDPDVVRVEDDY